MKFSIIIPCYNEEEYLPKCLSAVFNLNWPKDDFEVIVVDNNSSDKTSDIAKKMGANKVLIEKKIGSNQARQTGVNNSLGDIICFLDADCEPKNDWLNAIDKEITKRGVVAVGGPYNYFGYSGFKNKIEKLYQKYIIPYFVKTLSFIFRRPAGVLNGGNCAVKKEALLKIGGLDSNIKFYGDDADTAIRLAKEGRVVWSVDLTIKSSPRRFEKEGTGKVLKIYILNYLGQYFFKKPIIKK